MRTLNKLLAFAMALVVPLCTWAQTEIEPNNSTAQATAAAYNTAMAGSTGACAPADNSVDYFSFTPPQQGVLRIQTAMSNTGATDVSVSVQLRNSSGSVLATFIATAGANNVVTNNAFTQLCGGTGVYFINILNPSTTVCTNYSLTYDVIAPVFGNDLEPNQSTAQATDTLDTSVDYDGHLDFNYDDDFDYFRILAPNDGVLNVTVSAEHAGASTTDSIEVYLRSNSGSILVIWKVGVGANSVPNTQTFARTCTGTEAVYFLEPHTPVRCGVSYRFNYTVTPPLYADDTEPNQSTSQALIANANTNYDGRLDFEYDNDFDYYRIQAPNDGVLNVTVSAEHAGSSNTDSIEVYLRSSSGSVLRIWNVGIGANGVANTQVFTRTCTGTEAVYFLEPHSPVRCGVSYRFSYTVTPPLYADDLEPNQSTAQALVANANTDYDGRLDFEYDNDWDYWRLQAPNDGVLNVTISAEHAGPSTTDSLEVRLRTNSGSQIMLWKVGVGANGAVNTQILTHTCIGTEQVYYLEPHSPVRCGVSYRFNYTVTPPLFADDAEPNQSTAQATLIDLNTAPAFGRLTFDYDNNFDYFRVNHPGGVLTVNTSAENAGAAGVMTVFIRSNSGSQIAINSSVPVGGGGIAAAGTTATAGPVAAGVYYIEPYSPSICGVSYRLDCYDDDSDGVCNTGDLCANTPTGEGVNSNGCSCSQVVIDDNDVCTLDECLNGNVTNTFQDADNDLTCDANDGCPNDPNKIAPGQCGCGVADTDSDGDLTADCNDACPNDPNKIAPGICGCGVSDVDTDSDGTADCNDLCPNDPNKVAPGACGCGIADTDTDSDGTADCNDACPNLANLVNGDPCDDGNPNTINDVVSNCICAGTLLGNDCEGVPGGPAQPGTACNDNDACTTGDVYQPNCLCAGTFADADADGTCDANDLCPGGPEPGTACNDNDACTTGDVIGTNCLCAGTFADADADGTCDADDLCPGGPEPGTVCNDNNAATINDIIQANCLCAGTLLGNDCEGVPGGPAVPGTACDDNDDCTTGDVYDANCLCAGTFADADADGTCDADDLCPGGPEPGTVCNDNNACTTGDVIGTNCLCAGIFQDADADGTCDANDLCPGGPEPGTACNDGNANTNNDVIGANCLCAGTPIGGGCQPTQLTTTADPVITCNIVNVKLDGTTTLWAYEVPGANRYQFLFTNIPGQPAYSRSIAGPDRSRQLFQWYTTPLKAGRTYRVTVRASFDNGVTWCAYGSMCTIRVSNQPNAQFRDLEEGDELSPDAEEVTLQLFPNPVRDGRVTVNMTGLSTLDEQPVVIDVFDALGRRVQSERSTATNGELNHVMQFSTDIGTGLYTVVVSMGDERYHERIVIE